MLFAGHAARRRRSDHPSARAICSTVLVLLAFALAAATPVFAQIAYSVEDLPDTGSGDLWRYTYVLPPGFSLGVGEGIAVHFPPDLFGELSAPVAPAGGDWSALAIQPDPLLPDDGAYDLLVESADPDTAGPFQIDFVWSGPGSPGSQPYIIYADGFQPTGGRDTVPVPEPEALLAGVAALAALAARRRRAGRSRGRKLELTRGLGAFVLAALATVTVQNTAQAQSVVHSFETGNYRIDYWQVERMRVERTVTEFGFEAEITRTSGSALDVVATVQSTAPSSVIDRDALVFGDVATTATPSQGAFTFQQDRTVPFDPTNLVFSVEENSANPCLAFSLGLDAPATLEPVPLEGPLSPDATTTLTAKGPSTEILVPISQADDDSYFFSAPIHPDLGGEAGSYRMLLETGGTLCDLGTLAVPALAPASADQADEILALLEQVALALMDSYGFDPASFDPAAPAPTASELLLGLLWRALVYDASPTRIPEIRAQVAALPEDDRVLLGRILTEAGVRETLDELLALYGEPTLPSPGGGAAALIAAPESPFLPQAASAAAPVASASAALGDCVPASFEKVSIVSAAELSGAMQASVAAATSLEREATRRKVASTVLGAAGFAGLPGQVVAVAGGAVLLVQEAGDENSAKLLPSQITETIVEAQVNPINEDYLAVLGQQRPRVFLYTSAASLGMSLGKRVLDIALKSAAAVPGPAQLGAALTVFDGASTWAFQSQPTEGSCFLIPAQSWTRIPIGDAQWLTGDPVVSGSSVDLVETFEMDPVDIGTTNLDFRLDAGAFPCVGTCTIDQLSDDVDVEVRAKEVVFSLAEFPIDGAGGVVLVTGTIQNSSRPDLWGVEVGSGVTIVGTEPPSPSFALTLMGLGAPDLFPTPVTVRSNSTTLPAGTPAREATAMVVLESMIQVFQSADECVGPDVEVTLDAVATGLEVPDVAWTQPPNTFIDPVTGTRAIFTASEPGTYTVTATSVEDPAVSGSIDVVVTECEIETYFWGTAQATTPSSSEDAPPCGPGSSPDGQSELAEIGVEPDFFGTGTLRNPQDWTGGGSFPLDLFLTDVVNSTFEIDQVCESSSIPVTGSVLGDLSSVGGSNTVDVDFEVALEGGCDDVTDDFRECQSGTAVAAAAATFVFEHVGEGVQSYQYAANLDCTLTPSPLTPGTPNVLMSIAVMDSSGVIDPNYAFQVLTLDSLLALTRAATAACYSGQPVAIQERFDFQDFPGGGTYTAAIVVTLNGIAVPPSSPNPPAQFTDEGAMQGSISVQPLPAP